MESFNFALVSLQNEALNIKIMPPEIQESEFTTLSNQPQLSRWNYLIMIKRLQKFPVTIDLR